MIAFDTETHLITRHDGAPRCVVVSLCSTDPHAFPHATWRRHVGQEGQRGVVALMTPEEGVNTLRGVMESGDTIVGHNVAYDLGVLCAYDATLIDVVWRAVVEGRVRCTSLRDRLLAIATGTFEFRQGLHGKAVKRTFSLEDCVDRAFGIDLSASKKQAPGAPAPWRLRYAELDGVPFDRWPDEATQYATDDAYWALMLEHEQGTHTLVDGRVWASDGAIPGEAREVAAAFALHLCSLWGLRTDPEAVAACLRTWRDASDAGRSLAREMGWVRVAGRDKGTPDTVNKAALSAAVESAYLSRGATVPYTDPSKTYPRGQISVSEESIRGSGDATLQQYAKSLQATSHLTKYGTSLLLGLCGALTSHPNALVENGRTSWSDPPLQQPPRKGPYRRCFVPRPGYLYCGADYSFLELCTLAQVCLWRFGRSTLADTINAGRDPHIVTAGEILALDGDLVGYDDLVRAYKAGDTRVKAARQSAKAVNFGFPGGLGPDAFVEYAHSTYDLTVDRDQAQTFRNAWFNAYPEMRPYFASVTADLEMGATIEQYVSGRVCDVGGRFTKAANGYFSGLAADGAKYALVTLSRAAYTGDAPHGATEVIRQACADYLGARPVLFLHDEIIVEVPEDRAVVMARAQSAIMVWAMSRHVPAVRIAADSVLMRRWVKGAEPTYTATGQLVVTEER